MKFPSIAEVAKELRLVNASVDGECPVWLQVFAENDELNGAWVVWSGDIWGKRERVGFWGSASIPGVVCGRVARFNSREVARILISQVRDGYKTRK